MRKRSILLLAGALAIVASLVVGPAATAGPERASAGTVVLIHDQEPPNLQANWTGNGLYATALVLNNIWAGGGVRNSKAAYVPTLFTALPKLVKKSPLTVTFQYKPTATWSDGKPVTCADWRATWQVYINPQNNVDDRTGYEDVRSVKCAGKKGTVVFKKQYADWEALVTGTGAYAAHIVKGKNMNEQFLNSIPVSSGPWKFSSWQKGVQLTLVKNPRFRATAPMKLDRVVFRYILDTNARFQALKAGEGQAMESQAQPQIASFFQDKSFVVDYKIGYQHEHIDIQFGPQGHPALKQAFVRQALITGINRNQVAKALYKDTGIFPGKLPALQSHMFKPFEPNYKPNFNKYSFNQAKVISSLKAKGCTGGPDRPSAGNSNIFSCPGVGKLSFRFFTTTGNALRALTFEIIQRQLKSVGIELVPRFQTGGTMFGTTLPSRDWDLMLFTWVSSPSWGISSIAPVYGCGGDSNDMGWCNQKFTALAKKVQVTLDAKERGRLLNQAESKFMVPAVPTIPMFARPGYTIRSTKVKGLGYNPTTEGYPWNVNTWTVS
jgi:peptide/nickel transport system substrate-binding protein